MITPNILFPNRVFTETKASVPEGVKYSWTWSRDHCCTTLIITNPTPEQLAKTRQHLNVKEAK